MKNILSRTATAVILLLVTLLFLGFYTYMLARPISYAMPYHNESMYEDVKFEGTVKYYPNGKMFNENSNFPMVLEDYYYYKDGYIFNLIAKTDEEYEAEVADINENFEAAVASPFYASKINAFRQTTIGPDGYATTYTCAEAITIAIAGGIAQLVFIALTVASFILCKKAKCKESV